MYIVKVNQPAVTKFTSSGYVVLNRFRDLRDHFFERIVNDVPEVEEVLSVEFGTNIQEMMEDTVENYGLNLSDARSRILLQNPAIFPDHTGKMKPLRGS